MIVLNKPIYLDLCDMKEDSKNLKEEGLSFLTVETREITELKPPNERIIKFELVIDENEDKVSH